MKRRMALLWDSLLRWTGKSTAMGGRVYRMDVRNDVFVHFTALDRAVKIMEEGVLLMHPPHEKFGTDTVNAVSTIYGWYVPTVQTTHMKGDLAAILFETSTPPEYGHVEEVVWKQDVVLRRPELLEVEEAIHLLNNSPAKLREQDMVVYK